ncbi:TetR/AcrR family transcriptional regulator [Pedococcus sp. KACC 23699]|uniref:TetR/AcrR family transcriptional regulator n=1 Tax=Pedococcus sp. KACC 23699 TaxID=3149228 RepID=A0AAU7JR94_9MICO
MARPQAPRGQGRARVLAAALELFALHGVSGTSLQMIADHLGVTKAAVYYQFHAKEDIVLAVVENAVEQLRGYIETSEAAPTPQEATAVALDGLVDVVLAHRKVVAAMLSDPEVSRILEAHEDFTDLTTRLGAQLLGPAPSQRRVVAVPLLALGIAHAGADPHLVGIDDETLRAEMRHLGRVLVDASTSVH